MRGKMKAVVKHHRGFGAEIQSVDIPQIKEDEVLIKIKATSICGTDVHIYKWDEWSQSRVKPPYVLGHEFSGIVVEKGEKVSNVEIGDSVSAETHLVCGRCPQCLTGHSHICQDTKIIGVDTQGCFSEYIALPTRNIWKNPKELPYDIASIQEPFGNAVHTVLTGNVVGKIVAIIGCGPIGLMAVGIAKAAGAAQVIAFDIHEYRLELAKKMGATKIVHSKNNDPLFVVHQISNGNGADVVCEMSGHSTAIIQGFKMVKNGGLVSILGLPNLPVEIDVANDIVLKGITVKGITGRKMYETWYQTSALIYSGNVKVKELITHQFSLEEFEKGFKLMIEGNCGKVILIP
ncbi:L-threonine 3-dehydrogenase [Metabacillus sediminilitoris]|uniref:L-threonine 3-dehydrogenase n=1 Tax=Metabacillus sediminilitoris TaxID=2567941 RepID=A0A4S4C1J1_9BACI|nr:L-threonine 3-dehydrogenase [Metabacillus sediminilitoris]QGQ46359.1 L-threonine 3-dehydrogenase [Metabacillus sediminilitoris]THF79408.1 L-threonine 3-dehydrogenase [Metabacillus sediminilitoris]